MSRSKDDDTTISHMVVTKDENAVPCSVGVKPPPKPAPQQQDTGKGQPDRK